MTNNQEDNLTMSQTTISFLQENDKVWKSNASITSLIGDIDTENNTIVDNQAIQEKDHTGITEGKSADRTALENDIHTVSNALSYFAGMTKNNAVKGIVKKGTLDLSGVSGEKLIGIAKIILQSGTDNLSKAIPYGFTQLMLDSLQTSYDTFVRSVNLPRTAITAAAAATEEIAAAFSRIHDSYKNKLDKAMVFFKTNTAFYNQYKKVRIVVHSPTHHIAATAVFMDAGGKPVQDVKVAIDNGSDTVRRKSSPSGNIRVQNLLDGSHTLVAEKPGFEKAEMLFIVAPPETTKLTIVLKAL